MKRRITCIFLIVLLLSMTVFHTVPAFAQGDGQAAVTLKGVALAGKNIKLTVSLSNMPAYDDLGIKLSYDSAQLALIGGEWLKDGALEDFDVQNGLAVWTGTRVEAVNGDVLEVEFTLDEAFTPESDISVACEIVAKAKGVTVANLNPSTPIEVITFIYGDANGDGEVDEADLLRLRKYIVNFDETTQESTVTIFPGADANGDGEVDEVDLLRLRKYFINYDEKTGQSTVVLGPQ